MEKRDRFGKPGTIRREVATATVLEERDLDAVCDSYLEAGFTELPRDSLENEDRRRLRLDLLEPRDPFLWEREAVAGVGGRELVGAQRELVAKKVRALREELGSSKLKARRRALAEPMLAELERGLLPRIANQVTRVTFHMDPIHGHGGELGRVVPLSRMSQLVYRVMPRDPEKRVEGPGEPMYMTVLGVEDSGATFLYSGGIVGQRTVTNLDEGVAHHAWFQNRQSTRGDDTAPWVSRRVYRELANGGDSRLVVRWGREDEPIPVRRTGEETLAIAVDDGELDAPVLVAETAKDDRLWILADPESPLVLKMEEAGADLLRSIDGVRRLEGY